MKTTLNSDRSSLHPLKLTVWWGLHTDGIIGLYFFRNGEGVTIMVNGERYRAMLSPFLFPKINQLNFADIWFQQDDGTYYTARSTIDLFNLLTTLFPEVVLLNSPLVCMI